MTATNESSLHKKSKNTEMEAVSSHASYKKSSSYNTSRSKGSKSQGKSSNTERVSQQSLLNQRKSDTKLAQKKS